MQSFDGGIADEPLHEPHAGYTFCCVGALNFVGRLDTGDRSSNNYQCGPSRPQDTVRWLVYRQTDLLEPDALLDSEFIGSQKHPKMPRRKSQDNPTEPVHQSPEKSKASPFDLGTECAGMNGRTNKVADTCYAWWAGAPLHILGHGNLYNHEAVQRYLLERTQHPVLGGFGKFPGDLPDLYHSYIGLAALSLAGSTDVKEIDAGMCVSKEASAKLERLWKAWNL